MDHSRSWSSASSGNHCLLSVSSSRAVPCGGSIMIRIVDADRSAANKIPDPVVLSAIWKAEVATRHDMNVGVHTSMLY
jgi:hypothetical protein